MNRRALAVTVIPIIALMFIVVRFTQGTWTPLRMLGLVLTIFGFAMVTIARVNLGNAFSVSPQANILVTNGIYSRVRHPIYVFSTIALAGLALFIGMPILLLGLLILIPVQVLRARAEERVLEARFGDSYRQYRATTLL